MPFWSSENRAMTVIRKVAAYAQFTPVALTWSDFCERWIPGLAKDGSLAGINWSGAGAMGYDVEPSQLQRNVEALLESDA
jgi:hypothetical protein